MQEPQVSFHAKKPYSFQEQLEKQQKYFDLFREWLDGRENVLGVTIADDIDEKRGIDLWAIMQHRDPVPIQVKTDFIMHQTGNVAVEMVGQLRFDGPWKPGWLAYLCHSKLLVYIDAESLVFRSYDTQAFFKRVMDTSNFKSYTPFAALNGSEDGGDYWYGMGVLVPLTNLSVAIIQAGDLDEKRHSDTQHLIVRSGG